MYHWLQAFHDLGWRGNPDRQIGATHRQTWLQADAQHGTVRGQGLAPTARALDASAPGRALAPQTVLLANLPFNPAPESSVRKSVSLPPARGVTEPKKCLLCADTFYTSGAMLEHLTWHAVHAAAPAEDREATSHIIQGRARRLPWHAPYAQRPALQAPDNAASPEEGEEAADAVPGAGVAAHEGSIPAGLAIAPLWAPLVASSPHPLAPAPSGDLADPADPAAMPVSNR